MIPTNRVEHLPHPPKGFVILYDSWSHWSNFIDNKYI